MSRYEYEDYMYEDAELFEDYIVIQKNSDKQFLNKLDADAKENHYELLAERYNCL